MDPGKIEVRIAELKEKFEDLRKKVNVNIELMYEKTSKWHEELIRKRQTLQENKANIEDTIRKLDIEKNKDLEKTVKEVDKNLNEIFSVLLQNTQAHLQSEFEDGVLTGL